MTSVRHEPSSVVRLSLFHSCLVYKYRHYKYRRGYYYYYYFTLSIVKIPRVKTKVKNK